MWFSRLDIPRIYMPKEASRFTRGKDQKLGVPHNFITQSENIQMVLAEILYQKQSDPHIAPDSAPGYMTKSSFLPLHVRLDMGNTLTPGRAVSGMILRCRDNETCEMKRESRMPQWDVTAASWNDGSPQKCPLLSMWGIATNWSEKPWVLQGAFTHVLFKRDDVILFFINFPTLTPWYFSRSSENVTPQSRGVPKGNRMALVSLTFLKRTCVPCYYYNLDQRSTQIVCQGPRGKYLLTTCHNYSTLPCILKAGTDIM